MDNLVKEVVEKVIDLGISYKMSEGEIIEFNTKVIEAIQANLDEFKKFLADEGYETCVSCKDYFPPSDLQETSMGKICDICRKGIESREGKI